MSSSALSTLDSRPGTVLVVDDNPSTLYSTSRFLRAAGFNVTEAATGEEALKRAEGSVDVVILDVNLPDIDGFEVCRRLRGRETTARTTIIHLSATFAADMDKVHGLDAGADGYLTHPVEPPVLIATVNAFLRARQAEEGMRQSEEKFRAIFNQAINGIILISQELVYVEVNPAMANMLGRPREEIVGRHMSGFLPRESESQMQTVSTELQTNGQWRGTMPHLHANGNVIELEWHISTHTSPGMRLGIVTDITERRAFDTERERLLLNERTARAEAERANQVKDEFLATLSHELRTPLNAIVGWAQILKSGDAKPEDVREGIEAIERNAKVQTELISDLLDVSRIISGKMRLDLQPVEPARLIRSAIEGFSATAIAKGIVIDQDLDPGIGMINVDPGRIQQVIWNLGHNAVKFTPPGGEIIVRMRRRDDEIEITVSDTGQGINPSFLPHIFERFRQEDGTTRRNHGGLGLGLAIVKHLVEMHGGRIDANSDGEGKGATFSVYLPLKGPPALAQDRGTGSDSILLSATPHHLTILRGFRILVVDDDHDARTMIHRVLKRYGADVTEAETVDEALNLLTQSPPAILISDIGMPRRDGYDLIQEVRSQGYGADALPAIALTAFARPEDQKQSVSAGFQKHMAKPVDTHALIEAIVTLVGQAKPAKI